MKHFPIFVSLSGKKVVVAGGGEAAIAKLRLLLKTEAQIIVIAPHIAPQIKAWHKSGRLEIRQRPMQAGDARGAALFYAAHDEAAEDARTAALARAETVLVNWVDNLEQSEFITPAIVDRDPVTVAIGTEGAAPVLARAIKKDIEEKLPSRLGALARIGKTFRHMAENLPFGRPRRDFWSAYYFAAGPKAFDEQGEQGALDALHTLLEKHQSTPARQAHVDFVGAGPGDPELLTLKARRILHEADVVLYDRLISAEILELARREALLIEVGKTGFGPSLKQDAINALITKHATDGAQVVRLKSGDASIFGRLDEELDAVQAAGISYAVIPGITAASGAAAAIGQSLTQRGRNSSLRFITAHDMNGFAEQDWRQLSQSGQVAAIYMGKRAAKFMQGRLLMFGANPQTPMSIVENVSRPNQMVLSTTLAKFSDAMVGLDGPVILFLGLSARSASALLPDTAPQELVG